MLFITIKQQNNRSEEDRLLQDRLAKQRLEEEAPLTLLDDLYSEVDAIHKENAEFLELGVLLDEIRRVEPKAN